MACAGHLLLSASPITRWAIPMLVLRRLSSRMCDFLNTAAVMMWRAKVRIVVAYHGAHCRDMPWRATRCRAMQCHAMSRHALPCYACIMAHHVVYTVAHHVVARMPWRIMAHHGAQWRTMLYAHRGDPWCTMVCCGMPWCAMTFYVASWCAYPHSSTSSSEASLRPCQGNQRDS